MGEPQKPRPRILFKYKRKVMILWVTKKGHLFYFRNKPYWVPIEYDFEIK